MKKILIIFTLFCLPSTTLAVTYFFDPPEKSLNAESQFTITLKLDPENEFINAVEGVLRFPNKLLKVVNIDYDDSVVSTWIIEPNADKDEIHFSGIIPGGFDGVRKPLEQNKSPGNLFYITFEGRRKGSGAIALDEVMSLKNDGLGSEVLSTTIPFAFDIKDGYPPQKYGSILTLGIILVIIFVALLRLFL